MAGSSIYCLQQYLLLLAAFDRKKSLSDVISEPCGNQSEENAQEDVDKCQE